MNLQLLSSKIKEGKTSLGIELGSTRIKAVLITDDFQTIATGTYDWENELNNDVWTYSLNEAWKGIQSCYAQIAADIQSKFHISLTEIGVVGVSAMMHGYLPFSKEGKLLVPFRTWRNNITEKSSKSVNKFI